MAKQSIAQKNKAASTLGGMKGAAFRLTGDEALIRNLGNVRDSVARKALKKGLAKAMRIIVRSMKAAVPVGLKSMKPAIGGTVGGKKNSKAQFTAKAGAAVGKASKVEAKAGKTAKRRGVGIGGRNIHWWILGTGSRTVTKTGKNVGSMPALASNVIRSGFSGASGQAAEVIKSEIAIELAKPHRLK